jgi:hypothetical protein
MKKIIILFILLANMAFSQTPSITQILNVNTNTHILNYTNFNNSSIVISNVTFKGDATFLCPTGSTCTTITTNGIQVGQNRTPLNQRIWYPIQSGLAGGGGYYGYTTLSSNANQYVDLNFSPDCDFVLKLVSPFAFSTSIPRTWSNIVIAVGVSGTAATGYFTQGYDRCFTNNPSMLYWGLKGTNYYYVFKKNLNKMSYGLSRRSLFILNNGGINFAGDMRFMAFWSIPWVSDLEDAATNGLITVIE